MNIYFLVEGKTERKVYPQWLSYLVPKLTRVSNPSEISDNNYFLISGNGFPSILDNHLIDSVEDVNSIGNFDFLILVIDTDEIGEHERIEEIDRFISSKNIILKNCELLIFPQVVCMETWFLGNRKIYSRKPQDIDCAYYSKHYDVSKYDPELMQKPNNFTGTNADYHFNYLKTMLRAKNIRYSKAQPTEVDKSYYIDELKDRVKLNNSSLKSLQRLFRFFNEIGLTH